METNAFYKKIVDIKIPKNSRYCIIFRISRHNFYTKTTMSNENNCFTTKRLSFAHNINFVYDNYKERSGGVLHCGIMLEILSIVISLLFCKKHSEKN